MQRVFKPSSTQTQKCIVSNIGIENRPNWNRNVGLSLLTAMSTKSICDCLLSYASQLYISLGENQSPPFVNAYSNFWHLIFASSSFIC